MEPRIQYAKTEDGVSIAYWTMGEGTPFLVLQAWPYEHCQLEWQLEDYRLLYEPLVSKRRLIRFDGRGSGLSERHVKDYSLEARLLDTEAVVQHLGLDQFSNCAFS